ncbi:unknown [Clostridium sp. CAG:242]|nr:unknown [Clostridium sp. CAG:242]
MFVCFQTFGCGSDQWVWRSTQRHDNSINWDLVVGTFNWDWTTTTGSVWLAQFHLDALDCSNVAVFVAEDLNWVGLKNELDAFFFCMMNFFFTSWQLSFRTSVDDVYVLSTQSHSASCSVHCNVTAANNCYGFAFADWGVVFIQICFHEVDSGEEFVCGRNANEVFAFDTHEHWQTSTGTYEYSFKAHIVYQLIDRENFTDNHVGHNFYAHFFQAFNFLLYNCFWKSEFRNTINQNAACFVESFEDGYIVAFLSKVASTGQTCRACTDNSNFVTVGNWFFDLMFAILHIPISSKSFQTADCNWLTFDAAYTFCFTLCFLWANTSANCWQSACFFDCRASISKFALSNQADEFWNLYVYWAAAYTWHVFAVEAALCFLDCHFFGISVRNFFKVSSSYFWVLLRHREFCHTHIRHCEHLSVCNVRCHVVPVLCLCCYVSSAHQS